MNNINEHEINDRLSEYVTTYSDNLFESTGTTFQPSSYLAKFTDYCRSVDLFVCERKPKCTCKGECWCDSEDYCSIRTLDVEECSNCNCILTLVLPKKVKFGKKMNKRIFSLDKNDVETVLCDITPEDVKLYLPTGKSISFQTFERGSMTENTFTLRFNLMLFEEL